MKDSEKKLKNAESEREPETVEELLAAEDEEFYAVKPESGNLLYSVLSISLAVLSVVLFAFFYVGGIIAAVAAIVFAILSSRKLGFFDRMALFGLIFGIFGLVFGVFSMVLDITGTLDGVL